MHSQRSGLEVAIIGVAARFPKSSNTDEFWRNLRDGVECITFLTDEESLRSGVDERLLREPDFVKAASLIDGIENFDADFFGYSPMEAALIDPQHRLFLECAVEALETAGYNPETHTGAIGVYGGTAINTYLLFNVMRNQEIVDSLDQIQLNIASDKDYLTTRVSYKLNLKGPSHLVQSACSTSLVAVHVACQSLLNEECDLALAGGVTININRRSGYRYLDGGMASPDGHCRAFDAKARGTIFGSGAGIVALKRLEEAIEDGDTIHAVIKGSAINNDGSMKVGYTAPSVDGQAEVITEALANAGVTAETIDYIETHGTGTPLGDPIEVQALTKAYRAYTEKKGFCAIGSVKTNVGHLDAAAGVAGLIKTVLSLKHRQLPPTLHFQEPNPNIDFAGSPFYVNDSLKPWLATDRPRRAGVSSFGVGGTNAHLILEQAPELEPGSASRPWQALCLSAHTATALQAASARLASRLREDPDLCLADVAYTLAVGRRAFAHRRVVICRSAAEACALL
ncbi:MAG TPA: type I polyketide synthase, partial [Blastocatellia bacterium]|nr:type I polyketide synthase [Blastocatellia bacterium]